MQKSIQYIIVVGLLLTMTTTTAQNIFPGAVGQGTCSRGAYAGDTLPEIVYVDNLKDSGPGSFRAAVSKRGPRIVLFNVSGTIRLSRAIIVQHPYLFIAGQSAPGKGIALEGAPFIVRTHDMLVQDMRFRLGGGYPRQSDCLSFGGRNSVVYNVVFDRCSFAFGLDENIGIFESGPGITISYSIVGYGLSRFDHSMGVVALRSEGISLIGNIFAFNHDRNPNIRGDTQKVEILNNLIYNSGAHAAYLGSRGARNSHLHVLFEGNMFIPGFDTLNRNILSVHQEVADSFQVTWKDNLTLHEDRVLDLVDDQLQDDSGRFIPAAERPFEASPDELLPAAELLTVLPEKAGARPNNRDAVDSLIVKHLKNQTGQIIAHEDELGELPELPVEKGRIQKRLPESMHTYDENEKFTRLEYFLNDLLF
ncbi:MAG: pectate lyase [Marinilabiliaceae bacterium]